MARFRRFPPAEGVAQVPPRPSQLRRIFTEALRAEHFCVCPPCELLWETRPEEDVPWEVFQGRLLDRRQTRSRRTFESWNLYWKDSSGRSEEPILSIKLDGPASRLFVTRGLLCHVWEPYDAGDSVIQSRPATRWLRELVGEVDLASLTAAEVREEFVRLLFQAVVGLSRLPLTSVEAPLPGFSLGHFAYFYRAESAGTGVVQTPRELIRTALVPEMGGLEKVKLLEFVLRSARSEEIAEIAGLFVERWQQIGHGPAEIQALLRAVFVEVALSPYTDFVDNTLALVQALVDQGRWAESERIDFLTALLRQLGRHLSAYDLVMFHHLGANYPDALLLDAVMKACLSLAENHPGSWLPGQGNDAAEEKRKRLNRRGLRQGWLLRRFYEGHPVPDAPTSPGENARVLPAPHVHIPDEQIFMPHRRKKRLFDGDPLPNHLCENARRVLRESFADLRQPPELRELGTALFLDRPLGVAKAPLEPDLTLLLSYEAFSRSLAEKRLAQLARDPEFDAPVADFEALRDSLHDLPCLGLPLPRGQGSPRPVVSLQDAHKAGDDFVLLRTTAATVRDFLEQYDLTAVCERFPLDCLSSGERVLLLGGMNGQGEVVLTLFDSRACRRLEMKVCLEQGYETGRGVEFPRGGLQVLRVWSGEEETEVRGERLMIRARST